MKMITPREAHAQDDKQGLRQAVAHEAEGDDPLERCVAAHVCRGTARRPAARPHCLLRRRNEKVARRNAFNDLDTTSPLNPSFTARRCARQPSTASTPVAPRSGRAPRPRESPPHPRRATSMSPRPSCPVADRRRARHPSFIYTARAMRLCRLNKRAPPRSAPSGTVCGSERLRPSLSCARFFSSI